MTEGKKLTQEIVPRASLSITQKVGAGVVTALSVVLIAVSAYFVAAPAADGLQAGALFATTEEAQLAASADKSGVEASDAQEIAAGQDADTLLGSPPAADRTAATESASATEESTSSSSAPTSPSASAQPSTITVSVSVDSSAADGRVSASANPTFEKGASVYDALMACGLSVNASRSPFGIYVSAIGGLAEKEYAGESGWKFSVNGEVIMKACDSVILQDGDVVRWFYA